MKWHAKDVGTTQECVVCCSHTHTHARAYWRMRRQKKMTPSDEAIRKKFQSWKNKRFWNCLILGAHSSFGSFVNLRGIKREISTFFNLQMTNLRENHLSSDASWICFHFSRWNFNFSVVHGSAFRNFQQIFFASVNQFSIFSLLLTSMFFYSFFLLRLSFVMLCFECSSCLWHYLIIAIWASVARFSLSFSLALVYFSFSSCRTVNFISFAFFDGPRVVSVYDCCFVCSCSVHINLKIENRFPSVISRNGKEKKT